VADAASDQPSREAMFDLNAALARLGGDRELLCDLIGFFFEDSLPLLKQIQQGLAERNANIVERSAHSLKGLAANFSADRAVQAALRLEKMGHSGNLANGPEAATELEREITALREALALHLTADQQNAEGTGPGTSADSDLT